MKLNSGPFLGLMVNSMENIQDQLETNFLQKILALIQWLIPIIGFMVLVYYIVLKMMFKLKKEVDEEKSKKAQKSIRTTKLILEIFVILNLILFIVWDLTYNEPYL